MTNGCTLVEDEQTAPAVWPRIDGGVWRLVPKRANQCKDVPDAPVLRFLAQRPGVWHNWYVGNDKDVRQAMPPGLPDKLVLGKMRMLIRRGLVSGCDCGCRGDFEITPKGQAWLAAYRETPNAELSRARDGA